jgi:probable rRNA maturation factor
LEVTVLCRRVPVEPDVLARLEDVVFAGEGHRMAVSLVIIDDAGIRRVNRDHLDHDWPTDVIAFDLREGPDEGGPAGEILVNAEQAEREARGGGWSPESELLFYVAHGLLHLLGYDDATPEERSHMHRLQRDYLGAARIVPPPA